VEEMLATMSMSEYVHWVAIYETEPFPEERADLRAASIIQALILGRVKDIPKISDIMIDFDYWGENVPVKQSPAQIKANMELIKAATKKPKK
jgi:hypothetical protein